VPIVIVSEFLHSDVLVSILLRRGRDRELLQAELSTFLTSVVEDILSLLLGTGLLGFNLHASFLHGFAFLNRDSSFESHGFLVVVRDSLLDFLSELFTALMGFGKLGLVLGSISFFRVGLEAKSHFLVVADNFFKSFINEFLATLICSCELGINLDFGLLSSFRVDYLLALFHSLVVVGNSLLVLGSFLEAELFSSSEFVLIALSLLGAVTELDRVPDFPVVSAHTLDGVGSSISSTGVSSSKLGVHGLLQLNTLGLLLADSTLTSHLDASWELESLQVLLALSRGLLQLHGDLFVGVALLVGDESELESSRRCFTLGLFQVDLEFDDCGCR